MTLDQFNTLKQQIRTDLEHKLVMVQNGQRTAPASLTEEKTEYMYLKNNEDNQLQTLLAITERAKTLGATVTHRPLEESEGRVGYYKQTQFTLSYQEPVEEITDQLLKRQVHKALKSIIGISPSSYIKCEVMQLFKDSLIDWDAVVKSHKEDCTL